MSTYNKRGSRKAAGRSPVKTSNLPTGTTFEGHTAYKRDPKSELFITATSTFGEEDTFYEKGNKRRERIVNLTKQVAVEDPKWIYSFTLWLRNVANIRTISLVIGLEGAKAIADYNKANPVSPLIVEDCDGQGIVRMLAKAAIRRPDEPGEALAYWMNTYGGDPGGGVKRAIADRVTELYKEWSLLKYDTESHGFRFGDVIELVHPRAKAPWQSDLFKYAIERRRNRSNGIPESLAMVYKNSLLREEATGVLGVPNPLILLSPENLREAGMTWEDVLSLAGDKIPKKQLWEALIPTMGYMALLRNLRNFDQVGISEDHARFVAELLADPAQVARSRQLPMRFLTAYQNAPSLRWSWPLEQALEHGLSNTPLLLGKTLILVDTSSSMDRVFSDKSQLKRWDMASLFGVALARRCDIGTVVSFSGSSKVFPPVEAESLLRAWKRWQDKRFNLGGGTSTVVALQNHLRNHSRVVIITDEQASGNFNVLGHYRYGSGQDVYLNEVNTVVPADVPLHVINVAGYEKGMTPSGQANRHVYGGLGDFVFKLIPIVEAGASGKWPWEQ